MAGESSRRAPSLSDLARAAESCTQFLVWAGHTYRADDERPLGGPMAPKVGPRVSSAEIQDAVAHRYLKPSDALVLSLVRAWWIDSLHGVSVVAIGREDLPRAVAALLAEKLGSIGWSVDRHVLAVFKYGVLHARTPAPADTTGQPLEIEVFAELTNPVPAEHWSVYRDSIEMGADLEFCIVTATCSNLHRLGVGMPPYA